MAESRDFKTPDDWNARICVREDGSISYEETRVLDPEFGTLAFGDSGSVDPQTGEIDLSRGQRGGKSILDMLIEEDPTLILDMLIEEHPGYWGPNSPR